MGRVGGSPQWHPDWVGDIHIDKRTGLPRAITKRNLDCLRAYFRTGSRKEAGQSLGISEWTVRNHITNICALLNVTSAYEAAYVLWLRDLWGD